MIEVRKHRRPARAEPEWIPLQSQHALRSSAARPEARLRGLARGAPDLATAVERRQVVLQLDGFRRLLFEPLTAEEESGVLELAVVTAPRFARRVDHLRRQHAELRTRMEALAVEPAETGWPCIHAAFVALRTVLGDHDRAENEVLQRAYLEDIGGEG